MAGPINLGGDAAADIAASIAAADAATKTGNNEDQPGAGRPGTAGSDGAPADDGAGDEDADDAGDDDGLDAESTEADGEAGDAGEDEEDASAEDDEADDDADPVDSDALAKELGQLLIDDPKEFFKRTGIDPKVLKINGPKFEAMRKGLKEAKDIRAHNELRTKELDTYKQKVDAILEDGRQKYGPFIDLKNALGLDDFSAAKELLESLDPKKRSYADIAKGIVEAARATSPSEAKYKRLLREQAEKQRKDEEAAAEAKKAEERAAEAKALEQKNLAGAQAKLKGTEFEDIPGSDAALVRVISENWDVARKGLKISWQEVMKKLGEDPVMKLGLENKALKKGSKGKKTEPAPVVAPKKGDRTPLPRQKAAKVDADAELRAAMAEASRLEQASKRRAGAGKGRR